MGKFLLAVALASMTGLAYAGDIYLYDLLKDPIHARSWKAVLESPKAVPAWVRDENGFVADPAKIISIAAKSYSISVIAKQHATDQGRAAVLFNADGSKAWAEIDEAGRSKRYLGGPSAAQRGALDKALAE